MPDIRDADRAVCTILGDKVRTELGQAGRQAVFSAACLLAFADADLADNELSYISALNTYLGADNSGQHVTTRRQTREQIVQTFKTTKLGAEAVSAVLACLAYVALADGLVKPEERALLTEIGAALGRDARACTTVLEGVAKSHGLKVS